MKQALAASTGRLDLAISPGGALCAPPPRPSADHRRRTTQHGTENRLLTWSGRSVRGPNSASWAKPRDRRRIKPVSAASEDLLARNGVDLAAGEAIDTGPDLSRPRLIDGLEKAPGHVLAHRRRQGQPRLVELRCAQLHEGSLSLVADNSTENPADYLRTTGTFEPPYTRSDLRKRSGLSSTREARHTQRVLVVVVGNEWLTCGDALMVVGGDRS